jgi:hypothetical protein
MIGYILTITVYYYSIFKMLENTNNNINSYHKQIKYLIYSNLMCIVFKDFFNNKYYINLIIIVSDILLIFFIYKELQLLNKLKQIKNINYINIVYIINYLNIILYIFEIIKLNFKGSYEYGIVNTI